MTKLTLLLIFFFTFSLFAIEDAEARRRERNRYYKNRYQDDRPSYRKRGRRHTREQTPNARDQFYENYHKNYPGTGSGNSSGKAYLTSSPAPQPINRRGSAPAQATKFKNKAEYIENRGLDFRRFKSVDPNVSNPYPETKPTLNNGSSTR